MRDGFIRFWDDKGTKDSAMFVIDNWRTLQAPKLPVFEFLYTIEAVRRKLLTKEETKKLIDELALWLAQDAAIKRRKPRGTEDDIRSKLCRHKVWTKVYKKFAHRLEALQKYNIKNELKQWVDQQDAINNDNRLGKSVTEKPNAIIKSTAQAFI